MNAILGADRKNEKEMRRFAQTYFHYHMNIYSLKVSKNKMDRSPEIFVFCY